MLKRQLFCQCNRSQRWHQQPPPVFIPRLSDQISWEQHILSILFINGTTHLLIIQSQCILVYIEHVVQFGLLTKQGAVPTQCAVEVVVENVVAFFELQMVILISRRQQLIHWQLKPSIRTMQKENICYVASYLSWLKHSTCSVVCEVRYRDSPETLLWYALLIKVGKLLHNVYVVGFNLLTLFEIFIITIDLLWCFKVKVWCKFCSI